MFTDNFNFSQMLEHLKEGCCCLRSGWNGKGIHIYIEDECNMLGRKYEPVICMYNTQGKHQMGWAPSQQDLFANDWQILKI